MMSDEDLPAVTGLASIFPFVMVLSAYLVTGLVATAVNVPLLFQVLNGTSNSPLVTVVDTAGNFWRETLPASPGLGVVLLSMMGVLTIGFVVQPAANVYITVVGRVVEWVCSKHTKSAQFKSPPVLFGRGYLVFAEWIHRHRVEKSHWEWELFSHYLYGGITLNVLVAAFLTWLVTSHGPWLTAGLVTTVLLSTAHSLARSALMRQVFDFYSTRAGTEIGQTPRNHRSRTDVK